MASIQKYATKSGQRWRVQYRDPAGRSRTKSGFVRKREAENWAASNTVDKAIGAWLDPQAGKRTISDFHAPWDAGLGRLKPKTAHDMRAMWTNWVEPSWGTRQVASIRRSEVQAWVDSIQRSASLVRQAHAVLAQILDVAVMDEAISDNPARGVKLPRKRQGVKVYLTADELAQLAMACTVNREIVWVLGTVGLRWGELAGLRVRDVNVLRSRLHIEQNAVVVGTESVIGTPKSHERRTVAVMPKIMGMIVPLIEGRGPDELVWSRGDGSPLRPPSHGSWFHNAVERCAKVNPKFEGLTPHGLRHVAAGLMVSSGANVKVIQRQLGHASAAMTLDVYADLFDEDLDQVASRMEASFKSVVGMS